MYFIAHDIDGVAAVATATATTALVCASANVTHIYLISWRFARITRNSNERRTRRRRRKRKTRGERWKKCDRHDESGWHSVRICVCYLMYACGSIRWKADYIIIIIICQYNLYVNDECFSFSFFSRYFFFSRSSFRVCVYRVELNGVRFICIQISKHSPVAHNGWTNTSAISVCLSGVYCLNSFILAMELGVNGNEGNKKNSQELCNITSAGCCRRRRRCHYATM